MRKFYKKFLPFLMVFVITFSLFPNILIRQSKAADSIKIVGNWSDAGNWDFNSSTIVLNETSIPDLYYAEYTFTTAGAFEFKAVINGSI